MGFFGVAYILLHGYLFYRIAWGLNLKPNQKKMVALLFLIGASTFSLRRIFNGDTSFAPFIVFTGIWFGTISISSLVFIAGHLISLILPKKEKVITIGTIFFASTLILYAIYNGTRVPEIKTVPISITNLLEKLKGFAIVQLSDLHLDHLKDEKWIKSIIDRVNSLNPDIVVMTGDIIDRGAKEKTFLLFKELKTKYGVYAVTGNHDFREEGRKFSDFCQQANIRLLRNEHLIIAENIQLAGVDDERAKRVFGIGSDLGKALKGIDKRKPTILLAHKPENYELAEKLGVNLQLSGHLHRGQMLPYNIINFFRHSYSYGLHQHEKMYIYVTSGTGYWLTPMRLFSRSEIVKLVLQ